MFPANASGCVDYVNNYVQLFNNMLTPLVDNLNSNLTGAQFTYINMSGILISIIASLGTCKNDHIYFLYCILMLKLIYAGTLVFGTPCCAVSSAGVCVPNQAPCSIRDLYIFFDNYHTTELIDNLVAARVYSSVLTTDAYPFDIKNLAQQ